jgi:hypothetical protein
MRLSFFRIFLPAVIFAFLGFFFASNAHAAAEIGDLVTCPDSNAVYHIGDDGGRYVFPNSSTFNTWHGDFDDVKTIGCEDLGTLPLKGNVTYQPGTRLVKVTTVNTVYAVETDGTLRPIESEDRARELYGDDWAGLIDDVPDTFFPNYKLGNPLADDELPEGYLLKRDDDIFRVNDEGVAQQIDHVLEDDDEEFYHGFTFELDEAQTRLDKEFELLEEEFLGLFEDFFGEIDTLLNAVQINEEEKVDISAFDPLQEMEQELLDLFARLDELEGYANELDRSWEENENEFIRVDNFLWDVEYQIGEAADVLHNEQWNGKDTTEAWDLVDSAWRTLDDAWRTLDSGDFTGAEALGADALVITTRVQGGEGITTISEEDWFDYHDDECYDCWWDEDDYSDEDYWGHDDQWYDQWEDETYEDEWYDDWYTEWYDDCLDKGECYVENEYDIFDPGQVTTNDQLDELDDYLDNDKEDESIGEGILSEDDFEELTEYLDYLDDEVYTDDHVEEEISDHSDDPLDDETEDEKFIVDDGTVTIQ